MHLQIQVDIHSLQGTVCAWVPPPPNDRLWFGFITAPELKAEVTPIVANDVSPPHVFALLHVQIPFSQACGHPADFVFSNVMEWRCLPLALKARRKDSGNL